MARLRHAAGRQMMVGGGRTRRPEKGDDMGDTTTTGEYDAFPHDSHPLLDGAALYDVFYEAGTRLGGRYMALANKAEAAGDTEAEKKWMDAAIALDREREEVDPFDRAQQIETMDRWNARRKELGALL